MASASSRKETTVLEVECHHAENYHSYGEEGSVIPHFMMSIPLLLERRRSPLYCRDNRSASDLLCSSRRDMDFRRQVWRDDIEDYSNRWRRNQVCCLVSWVNKVVWLYLLDLLQTIGGVMRFERHAFSGEWGVFH